ncbi:MAG: hypothetical protein CL920_09260 [Deltaproteobacteria bacterium]|nr:hypothetical protein [Deltaproteobacteria bacterium]
MLAQSSLLDLLPFMSLFLFFPQHGISPKQHNPISPKRSVYVAVMVCWKISFYIEVMYGS